MKKMIIKLMLFAFVFTIFPISDVSALYVGRYMRIAYDEDVSGLGPVYYPDGTKAYIPNVNMHTGYKQTMNSYGSYVDASEVGKVNCIDPGLSFDMKYGSYKIQAKYDGTTDDLIYLGALSIYNKAKSDSRYGEYAITIALRGLFSLTNLAGASEGVYRDLATTAMGKYEHSYDDFASYGFSNQGITGLEVANGSNTESTRFPYRAMELLDYAYEVINYKMTGGGEVVEKPIFTNSSSAQLTDIDSENGENVTLDDGTIVSKVQKITITLEPEHITDDVTRLKSLSFWVDESNIEMYESSLYTLYDANGNIVTSTKDKNVLTENGGLFIKEGYKLTVEFSFIGKDDYCGNIDYGLGYELKSDLDNSESSSNESYTLSGAVYYIEPVSSGQRFLHYNSSGSNVVTPIIGGEIVESETIGSILGTVEYCTPPSEDKYCELPDDEGNKILIPQGSTPEEIEILCPEVTYCDYNDEDGNKVIIPDGATEEEIEELCPKTTYCDYPDENGDKIEIPPNATDEEIEVLCPNYCTRQDGEQIKIPYGSTDEEIEKLCLDIRYCPLPDSEGKDIVIPFDATEEEEEELCKPKVDKESCETSIYFDNDCEDDDPTMAKKDDDLVGYILGPINIRDCIIDNEDDSFAENPYTASSCSVENAPEDNKYCTVACKEDYNPITISGSQDAISGKYFQIGLSLNRTKSCYSSQIDKEGFLEDMDGASDQSAEYANEYNYYNALYNSVKTKDYIIYYQEEVELNGVVTPGYYYYKDDTSSPYMTIGVVLSGINQACQTVGKCTFRAYSIGYDIYPTNNYATNKSNIAKYYEGSLEKNMGERDFEYYPSVAELEYYPSVTEVSYKKVTSTLTSKTEGSVKVYYIADAETRKKEIENLADSSLSNLIRVQGLFGGYVEDIEECTGWNMVYESEPKISYNYAEDYMDIVPDNDKIMVENRVGERSSADYCIGDYDEEYKICTGSLKTDYDDVPNTDIDYTECKLVTNSSNIEQYKCSDSDDPKSVKLVDYIKQTMTVESEYTTKRVFYTAFPSGNIIYNTDVNDDEGLQTEVVDGLPVMIKTKTGRYTYSFTFSNIGEYYDCSADGGRLIGGPDGKTVFDKYGMKTDYMCYYYINMNNCPNCKPTGSPGYVCPDGSKIPANGICPDSEENTCPTCILSSNSTLIANYTYRPVSTNGAFDTDKEGAFNPNDRVLGYNWDAEGTTYEILSAKANETLYNKDDGLLELGSEVYNGDFLVMKVTLTPALASYIRNENDEYDDIGGYTTDTVTCEDYTYNGVTYNYVQCKSDFLTKLITNYEESFSGIGYDNRDNENYWTMYDDIGDIDHLSIGGPAWK